MVGCSTLRKATCHEMEHCEWEVGKGCRKSGTQYHSKNARSAIHHSDKGNKITSMGLPKRRNDVMHITQTNLRNIQKSVDEDMNMKPDAREMICKLVMKYIASRFAEVVYMNYSTSVLKFVISPKVMGKKLSSIMKNKILNTTGHNIILPSKMFEDYFKNAKGNIVHMSSESAEYIARIIEYLIGHIMFLSMKATNADNRITATTQDVLNAINRDTDLIRIIGVPDIPSRTNKRTKTKYLAKTIKAKSYDKIQSAREYVKIVEKSKLAKQAQNRIKKLIEDVCDQILEDVNPGEDLDGLFEREFATYIEDDRYHTEMYLKNDENALSVLYDLLKR